MPKRNRYISITMFIFSNAFVLCYMYYFQKHFEHMFGSNAYFQPKTGYIIQSILCEFHSFNIFSGLFITSVGSTQLQSLPFVFCEYPSFHLYTQVLVYHRYNKLKVSAFHVLFKKIMHLLNVSSNNSFFMNKLYLSYRATYTSFQYKQIFLHEMSCRRLSRICNYSNKIRKPQVLSALNDCLCIQYIKSRFLKIIGSVLQTYSRVHCIRLNNTEADIFFRNWSIVLL